MKKLLISISIASVLYVNSYAINAKQDIHQHEQMPWAMKSLNLSAEQKQDIKQIHKETKQDLSVYREEQKQFRESMRQLMAADVWDEAAVRETIKAQMANQLQSKLIQAKSKNRVFQQFTEQQKTQIQTMRLEGKNSAKKNKKRHTENTAAKMPDKRIQRITKALSLSSEQQAQLAKMMETNNTLRHANKEQMLVTRTKLVNIIQAPRFDEDTWLAIHADNEQQKLDMLLSKAKARFDMLSVLDSEQQKRFSKIMQKAKTQRMHKGNR